MISDVGSFCPWGHCSGVDMPVREISGYMMIHVGGKGRSSSRGEVGHVQKTSNAGRDTSPFLERYATS